LLKKLKIYIGAVLIGTLLITSLAGTYSWFVQKPQTIIGARSYIGAAELTIEQRSVEFVVYNNSTINSFMRIGWTPVFYNSDNSLVAMDTSNVDAQVDIVSISNRTDIANIQAEVEQVWVGSRQKKMINLYENEKYLIVEPGQSISGRLELTGEFSNIAELKVVLTPECIQATAEAVENATQWGWDVGKVPGGGG
jgi:hypothetical protein